MRVSLLLALLILAPPALASGRFALVVGNNEGGPGKPKLWFAEHDAERIHRTLLELGEIPAGQAVLLQGASREQVLRALGELEAGVSGAHAGGEQTVLVLYFSGHAGPAGLELGSETWAFKEVKRALAASSADAKIAVVDACDSGALTQTKGARPAPAAFPLPVEQEVRGTAVVASSAAGEPAQESAALQAGFFSHYLEMALRGAGDADGDGMVTLTEAFRYTAAHTLVGTAATSAGAQHPTYNVQMSGRADVVLSNLRRAEARLVLPADCQATYFLRGPGAMVAEVPGRDAPTALALPAGRYEVQRSAGPQRSVGEIELRAGQSLPLPSLHGAPVLASRRKGADGALELSVGLSGATGPLHSFGLGYGARMEGAADLGPARLRLRLEGLANQVRDEGFAYRYRSLGATAIAALLRTRFGPLSLELGPEAGAAWAWQTSDQVETQSAPLFGGGAFAGAFVPLPPLQLGLEVDAGGQLAPINGERRLRPALGLALLAGWLW